MLRMPEFQVHRALDAEHAVQLYAELGDQLSLPCPKLRQLVQAGRVGDKTGHGVYDHGGG